MRTEIVDPEAVVQYVAIGRNIRRARGSKNLRQEDVANMLGISVTHFSNCERGMRKISLLDLVKVCRVLDVSLEDLLIGTIDGVSISAALTDDSAPRVNSQWMRDIEAIQSGCSDEARKYMLDACRNIASLDKRGRK